MVSSQFLCPDMLSKVFEHLDPGRLPEPDEFPIIIAERKVRKHTLALSARVCSAFTAPALDVLWRRADSFDHVLCLFPTYSPTECVSLTSSVPSSADADFFCHRYSLARSRRRSGGAFKYTPHAYDLFVDTSERPPTQSSKSKCGWYCSRSRRGRRFFRDWSP